MTNSLFFMFATLCPIASVEFTVPCPIFLIKLFARGLNLSPAGIEIASLNAFSSDYRFAVNA